MSEKSIGQLINELDHYGIRIYDVKENKRVEAYIDGFAYHKDTALGSYYNTRFQDNIVLEIDQRSLFRLVEAMRHVTVPRHPTARRAWEEYRMLKEMCESGMYVA